MTATRLPLKKAGKGKSLSAAQSMLLTRHNPDKRAEVQFLSNMYANGNPLEFGYQESR